MKTKAILIALLVLLIVPSLQAQDDPCMATGGFWNEETGRCTISGGVTIDISYPPMEAEFASTIIQDFLNDLQSAIVGMYAEVYDPVWEHFPWALAVDFESFDFSATITSLNFTVYQYTGGAHGNTFFATFIFDLENERVLGFDDLFLPGINPLETIYPIVQASLEEQLAEYGADVAWIADGTGMNPDNYQNVVVSADSLTFFFPPYQVGPYAFGPQQVSIPLADLSGILASPFRME
jgi:hypothetical protein